MKIDDVQYHNINEFSNDFDFKDVNEDLNCCDKCGIIVRWYDEMYWQGECQESYHYCMGKYNYDAVCDDCFYELSNQKIRTWFYKLKCDIIDFYYKYLKKPQKLAIFNKFSRI